MPTVQNHLDGMLLHVIDDDPLGADPGVGPEDVEPPMYSPLHPGLILVDPGNDAVWYTPVPTLPDPDKAGGNTTFVRGVNQPDTSCIPSPTTPCPA